MWANWGVGCSWIPATSVSVVTGGRPAGRSCAAGRSMYRALRERQPRSHSLLTRVHVAQSAALARLEDARLDPALAQVRMLCELSSQSCTRGGTVQPSNQRPEQSQLLGATFWPFRHS